MSPHSISEERYCNQAFGWIEHVRFSQVGRHTAELATHTPLPEHDQNTR